MVIRVGASEASPTQGHLGHWGGEGMCGAVVFLCNRLSCRSQNLPYGWSEGHCEEGQSLCSGVGVRLEIKQKQKLHCFEHYQFTQPSCWGDKGTFGDRRSWSTFYKGVSGYSWPAQWREDGPLVLLVRSQDPILEVSPSLAQTDHLSRTPHHLRWAPGSGQSADTGSSTQPAHCTKIAQKFPSHSLPPLHARLHPRGFGDLPLRPGVSRYAVLAGLGAAPDTELRDQHHGQFPAPGAHSGPGGGGGPESFLRRWRRWAAVPGNAPARVNR